MLLLSLESQSYHFIKLRRAEPERAPAEQKQEHQEERKTIKTKELY